MAGRYVCSWCLKYKNKTTYLNDIVLEGDKDSHGICPACKKEVDKEFDEFLKVKKEMEVIDDHKKKTKGKD